MFISGIRQLKNKDRLFNWRLTSLPLFAAVELGWINELGVEIEFSEFKNGIVEIDDFIAWEPYPSASVNHGVGKILMFSSQTCPNHPYCVIAVRKDFLQENRELIKRVLEIAC